MSLKNRENNEHSKSIKTKKDLIINTDLYYQKTQIISQNNNKDKLVINKEGLNLRIKEENLTSKNNIIMRDPLEIPSLENKYKNNELYKKYMYRGNSCDSRKNNRKKEIHIFTNEINNCYNNEEQIENKRKYNYYNNINLDHTKSKKYQKILFYQSSIALNNLIKRSKEKLYYYNFDYKIKIINDILSDRNKHIVILFKNYLIWNDPNDYLKRYYLLNESQYRLKPIAFYYNTYTYCFPNYYCNFEVIKVLLKNIKRKGHYLNEKELRDNKRYIKKTEINSIINYYDSEYNTNCNENNNEKDFVPLINSYDINNNKSQSQIYSVNKESLSLSSTMKNYFDSTDNNRNNNNINKNQSIFSNDNLKNIFNVSMSPIYNNGNNKSLFKDFNCNIVINSNTQKIENKDNDKNHNAKKIKVKKPEANELGNYENKYKTKTEKISTNKDNKKINLRFPKFKFDQINHNIKNKNFNAYLKTDYNDINNNVVTKKFINTKKENNPKKNNKESNNVNKKVVLETFLNKNHNIKDFSSTNHNKNSMKKIQSTNEIKNQNLDNKLPSHKEKLLKEKHNKNQVLNSDNSSTICTKQKILINKKVKKNKNLDEKKNITNIKSNLNFNDYFNTKYLGLLTKNDRKSVFSSKKNLELIETIHSLSKNKTKLLKITENSKSKDTLTNKANKLPNNRNITPLSRTNRQTPDKSNTKYKKQKSNMSLSKNRNGLLLSINTQKNFNKKINDINNNTRNNLIETLKKKNDFHNLMDNYNNLTNSQLNKGNYRINIYQNKDESKKIYKKIKNKIQKISKSNTPDIITTDKNNCNLYENHRSFKVMNSKNSEPDKTNAITKDNIYKSDNNLTINNDESNKSNYKIDNIIIKESFNENKNEKEEINYNYINTDVTGITTRADKKSNLNLYIPKDTYKNKNRNIDTDINNISINIIENTNKQNKIKYPKLIELQKKDNFNKKYLNKCSSTNNKNGKKLKKNNNSLKNIITKKAVKSSYDKRNISKKKDNNSIRLLTDNNFHNISANNSKNKSKKNSNDNINKDPPENLSERKNNKNIDINIIINDNNASNSKEVKNYQNPCITINPNKKINILKKRILTNKKHYNKSQPKESIENRSHKTKDYNKNRLHKKNISSISSFYENSITKNEYFMIKKNIYSYYCRNYMNKHFSIKYIYKSNNNK